MKKAIQYKDVLGNIVQLKTAIDTFKQIENKPCWIVESRKIFPQVTKWDIFDLFKEHYFETNEEAENAMKTYTFEYAEKAHKLGKKIQFEEVVL